MKIVTLATYRSSKLIHGGQIRLNAIHEILKRDGIQVHHVSVHTGSEEDLSSDETSIPIDVATQVYFSKNQKRQDVHACSIFDVSADKYLVLKLALDKFEPDLLWLEQPWLWPIVKRYLQESDHRHIAVIYGSQNIEHNLIEAAAVELDTNTRSKLRQEVKEIESDLCNHADCIIAVSPEDLHYFKSYNKPVLLAQNGVSPRPAPGGLDYWKNVHRYDSLCLFVGSAHPPNAEGFAAMLGNDLSFMSPNEKIVVVGGVCNLLRNVKEFRRNRGLILPRLALMDFQDAGGLSTFLHLSKAILLPIVSGGGTNLKTAEALYSRKPIIATKRAFRGYEYFMNYPNIDIVDNPIEFQAKLKNRLANDASIVSLNEVQADALDGLLWSRTLSGIINCVKDAVKDKKLEAVRLSAFSSYKLQNPHLKQETFVSEGVLIKPLLDTGWHEFEVGGTWSKDRVAVLKLRNPFEVRDFRVTVDVEVSAGRGGHNAIDVYTASRHHLSKICTSKSRRFTFSFDAKDEDFGSDNTIELCFQVQRLVQPVSKLGIKDMRALGCRVLKINLQGTPKSMYPQHDTSYRINSLTIFKSIFKSR